MTRPMPQGKSAAVGDAGRSACIDRLAPAALVPYLRLARADRPIGYFLLALPDGELARLAALYDRPLPSGQVSPRAAIAFMLALCLIGFAVLLSFNSFTIWLGVGVLPIVALYPFVKVFSHWPQSVLGLAFNWGATKSNQ